MPAHALSPHLVEVAIKYQVHALVVDASKSMEKDDWPPTRLDAALDAAAAYLVLLIGQSPNALFGLSIFSDTSKILTPLTPVRALQNDLWAFRTQWHRNCLEHEMHNTNIGEGLREAALMLVGVALPAQVVLLTDGEHNSGRDPLEVASQLKRIANLAVVGIGASSADVDERRLKVIASPDPRGGSQYCWLGDRDALKVHFERLAGGLCRS